MHPYKKTMRVVKPYRFTCEIFSHISFERNKGIENAPLLLLDVLATAFPSFPGLQDDSSADGEKNFDQPHLAMYFHGRKVGDGDGCLPFEELKRLLLITPNPTVLFVPNTQTAWDHLAELTHLTVEELRPSLKDRLSRATKAMQGALLAALVNPRRQVCLFKAATIFSGVAFAGLIGAGAAWLSVANNLSALSSLQAGALATVVTIAVLAIAAAVFASLGAKRWAGKQQDIRRIHHFFDDAQASNKAADGSPSND